MARFPNTATADELKEAHVAKMVGKKYDRARRAEAAAVNGISGYIRVLLSKSGSVAGFNRNTGKPHENKREIARNLKRASA